MTKVSKIFVAIAFIMALNSCNKSGPYDFRKKYIGHWKLHEKHYNSNAGNSSTTFKDYEADIKTPKTKLFPINAKTFHIMIGDGTYTINRDGQFVGCCVGGFFNEDSIAVYFDDCSYAMGARSTWTITGVKLK